MASGGGWRPTRQDSRPARSAARVWLGEMTARAPVPTLSSHPTPTRIPPSVAILAQAWSLVPWFAFCRGSIVGAMAGALPRDKALPGWRPVRRHSGFVGVGSLPGVPLGGLWVAPRGSWLGLGVVPARSPGAFLVPLSSGSSGVRGLGGPSVPPGPSWPAWALGRLGLGVGPAWSPGALAARVGPRGSGFGAAAFLAPGVGGPRGPLPSRPLFPPWGPRGRSESRRAARGPAPLRRVRTDSGHRRNTGGRAMHGQAGEAGESPCSGRRGAGPLAELASGARAADTSGAGRGAPDRAS